MTFVYLFLCSTVTFCQKCLFTYLSYTGDIFVIITFISL